MHIKIEYQYIILPQRLSHIHKYLNYSLEEKKKIACLEGKQLNILPSVSSSAAASPPHQSKNCLQDTNYISVSTDESL